MICMKCAAIVPNESRFCTKCGKTIAPPNRSGNAKKLNARNEWSAAKAAAKSSSQAGTVREPEHLFPWLKSELVNAIKEIPKHLKKLAIYAGIVLFVNLIFWTANFYSMPTWLQPLKGLFSVVIFLTATYNDIIPKTIFWVIVFTFGKKLFASMRKKGFGASFSCMKNIIPGFKTALRHLGSKAYTILLVGAGLGLIIANNFASYSRFSGARNKIDKYLIVLIIAFTISYLLGEAHKTGLFRFLKLGTKDAAALLLKSNGLSDDGVYVLISGFIAGLLLDAPLVLFQWMYGGYIMGLVAIAAGIVLIFTSGKRPGVRA